MERSHSQFTEHMCCVCEQSYTERRRCEGYNFAFVEVVVSRDRKFHTAFHHFIIFVRCWICSLLFSPLLFSPSLIVELRWFMSFLFLERWLETAWLGEEEASEWQTKDSSSGAGGGEGEIRFESGIFKLNWSVLIVPSSSSCYTWQCEQLIADSRILCLFTFRLTVTSVWWTLNNERAREWEWKSSMVF